MNRGKGAKEKAQETHIDTGTHTGPIIVTKLETIILKGKSITRQRTSRNAIEFTLCVLVHSTLSPEGIGLVEASHMGLSASRSYSVHTVLLWLPVFVPISFTKKLL